MNLVRDFFFLLKMLLTRFLFRSAGRASEISELSPCFSFVSLFLRDNAGYGNGCIMQRIVDINSASSHQTTDGRTEMGILSIHKR